jgi:hypothetical protein
MATQAKTEDQSQHITGNMRFMSLMASMVDAIDQGYAELEETKHHGWAEVVEAVIDTTVRLASEVAQNKYPRDKFVHSNILLLALDSIGALPEGVAPEDYLDAITREYERERDALAIAQANGT